ARLLGGPGPAGTLPLASPQPERPHTPRAGDASATPRVRHTGAPARATARGDDGGGAAGPPARTGPRGRRPHGAPGARPSRARVVAGAPRRPLAGHGVSQPRGSVAAGAAAASAPPAGGGPPQRASS